MNISITYASRRGEVWRLYRRVWRQRLWKTHALVFILSTYAVYAVMFHDTPTAATKVLASAGLALIAPIGLALYPLIRFKPQTRTLSVDDEGLATTIGTHSSRTPWSAFTEVQDDGDAIVILRRNLNAYVVPARAFANAAAREQFRDFVRAKVLNDTRVF